MAVKSVKSKRRVINPRIKRKINFIRFIITGKKPRVIIPVKEPIVKLPRKERRKQWIAKAKEKRKKQNKLKSTRVDEKKRPTMKEKKKLTKRQRKFKARVLKFKSKIVTGLPNQQRNKVMRLIRKVTKGLDTTKNNSKDKDLSKTKVKNKFKNAFNKVSTNMRLLESSNRVIDSITYHNIARTFIGSLTKRGLKQKANKIFLSLIEIIRERIKGYPLSILSSVILFVSPRISLLGYKFGGTSYKLPYLIPLRRRVSIGIHGLIRDANDRSERGMPLRLFGEISDVIRRRSTNIIKLKNSIHKTALANRPFLYRLRKNIKIHNRKVGNIGPNN
jgi:ribosomal protein S7